MHHRFFKAFLLCLAIGLNYSYVNAQSVHEPADTPAEWSQPYPPFRIAGNLFYVGTADLACYLITSPKGHILINTGLAASVKLLKASVQRLGYKINDIKVLLTTQAHYDHLGAMADIKKQTGALFMIDEQDAQVAADGGKSDYAFGDKGATFKPIGADRLLYNNDVISLGGTKLTMLHHPGHTKGSCSYVFNVKDNKRSYSVLIANMPSIVTEHRFDAIPAYPQIEHDYAYTFTEMPKLQFDIWLSSHASQFNLRGKHHLGDSYDPERFRDASGYKSALADLKGQFDKKLTQK